MTRRYRDGRLVRARRVRRASLQSVRNLVVLRHGGNLCALDRFNVMIFELITQTAAPSGVRLVSGVGCGTQFGADVNCGMQCGSETE